MVPRWEYPNTPCWLSQTGCYGKKKKQVTDGDLSTHQKVVQFSEFEETWEGHS